MGTDARLFAIDVDGTLLRSDKTLAPATVDAVHAVVAAGHVVCIASSRPPHGLARYLLALGLVAPTEFVAYQGGWVGALRDGVGEARQRHPLEVGLADDAWRAATDAGLTPNWHADDAWWVSRIDGFVEREAELVQGHPVVRGDGEGLPAPDKVLIMGAADELDRFAGTVTGDRVEVVRSAEHLLEITAAGVDKSTGVAAVAERAGIPRDRVVALGDGHNDIALFRWAGTAIAMGNAAAEVRDAADRVTASHDDDGVTAALRSFL